VSPLWKKNSRPAADLAERLDQLGLFGALDRDAAVRAKEAFGRKGIDAMWTIELGRDMFAGDSEDLAEGGVGEFLRELRPFLSARGVTLGEIEDRSATTGTTRSESATRCTRFTMRPPVNGMKRTEDVPACGPSGS
jgi:hypothetical protein